MLFNVVVDDGSRISGYLVPDSFSGSPSLRISDGANDLAVLPCREERPALVAAGRHGTGLCGFTIDETVIPDLPRQESLELYDNDTNLLIYRRRSPSKITQKRIFRLETHLIPLWRLDDAIEPRFQYFHKGIERYGGETTTQLFVLNNSSSLYLSGRIIFKVYETYIDETFNCVALLREPYLELAERLLALKLVRKMSSKAQLLGPRDMIAFGPAIEFAESLEPDEKLLHRAFANMPKAAIANLANPVTRQLAARGFDEVPAKGAVAAALRTLSGFSIVGLRERQDLFVAQLADLVGTTAESLPIMPDFSRTQETAALLRGVPEAGVLLEQDLEVYHQVKTAVEHALAGSEGA